MEKTINFPTKENIAKDCVEKGHINEDKKKKKQIFKVSYLSRFL